MNKTICVAIGVAIVTSIAIVLLYQREILSQLLEPLQRSPTERQTTMSPTFHFLDGTPREGVYASVPTVTPSISPNQRNDNVSASVQNDK